MVETPAGPARETDGRTAQAKIGKVRRGRPQAFIPLEELMEMADLVLASSDSKRGHYAAARRVIDRRYPQASLAFHQSRQKLLVRRYCAEEQQLREKALKRRSRQQRPAGSSSTASCTLAGLADDLSRRRQQLPLDAASMLRSIEAEQRARKKLFEAHFPTSCAHAHPCDSSGLHAAIKAADNGVYRIKQFEKEICAGQNVEELVARKFSDSTMMTLAYGESVAKSVERMMRERGLLSPWTKLP